MQAVHRRQLEVDDQAMRAAVFSGDTCDSGATTGFGDFLSGWRSHLGDGFELPVFNAATRADFRVRFRAARLGDVAITSIDGLSSSRTAGEAGDGTDHVRLWIVHRGEWALGDQRNRSDRTIAAGRFVLRHGGRLAQFATPPRTIAQVFLLPTADLSPLLGQRAVTGPVDGAEVRLLTAYARTLHRTLPGLGPAGVQAARNALVELAKAVPRRGFDALDPRLAPALAQAAKDLAGQRLTDPALSPAMLARELDVSVRTLQRAFAAAGESVAAYIRGRRLEEARTALSAPTRLSVSEVAAHWQFTDGSHFNRLFKRHYDQTPTDYIRVRVGLC